MVDFQSDGGQTSPGTRRRRSSGWLENSALSRTRSQEFNGVESIAVQEVPSVASSTIADDDDTHTASAAWPRSARYLVWMCAFLTSLSFGVTQVPMLYVFRLMTCDAYYADHPSQDPGPLIQRSRAEPLGAILSYALEPVVNAMSVGGGGTFDRCSIRTIESSTALSISLLGASTTVFGIANLFITGTLIKRIGVKTTLLINVFFPALRLLVQNIGVEVWGNTGIIIIQCSQIVSILGGPSGYVLALNTFITEVVTYDGRTAALGRLTGSMLFGAASGFLLGGIVADSFGNKAPFRLTFLLFMSACVYVVIFLPHIAPAEAKTADPMASRAKGTIFGKLLDPLRVFSPRKFIGRDGVVRTEYGAFLLAWGVFLGILATGYLPTLLQLYSTDVFGFGTKKNGYLIFMYSMLRGLFLTFAFPNLIALGRNLTTRIEERVRDADSSEGADSSEREPLLATQTSSAEVDAGQNKESRKDQTFTFDLTYTRFSLITDGLLTLSCSFVREGWQMYLVAAILPFGAGTGSASKGTILQMVGRSASSSERTNALAGVSLVENMARLSTTFVFGVIFAGFASIGRTEFVFVCNAAVAIIGFVVLLFARFPLEGSRPLDKEDGPMPAL